MQQSFEASRSHIQARSLFSSRKEIWRWNRASSQSRSMSKRENRRQAEEIKRGPTKKRTGY